MKTPTRCRWVSSAAKVLALAVVVAGCGKHSSPRLPVEGAVAYINGEAFNGSISFLPAAGRPGLAASVGVSNGYYRFDSTNGPTAGPQRVILHKISRRRAPPRSIRQQIPPAAPQGSRAASRKDTWTFSADVPLAGPYRYDFKLEP
jgi:hypothetical protein